MEMASADAENGSVVSLPLSSRPPVSSRRMQVSRPICSSSPGIDAMKKIGEAAGDLGWNGFDGFGREKVGDVALPEGEGVGWQSGSWVGRKPLPFDPSLPRPLVPYSSPPGWWSQA